MACYSMQVLHCVFADEDKDMSTVRLGRKWFLRLKKGDELRIVDEATGEVRLAEVTGLYRRELKYLSYDDVLDNHNPCCRTVRRLMEELRTCYGEGAITNHHEVTIIHFKLNP